MAAKRKRMHLHITFLHKQAAAGGFIIDVRADGFRHPTGFSHKLCNLFWFIPVSGDGTYIGTEKGHRPADFPYLKQIAQAADQLGYTAY